MSGDERDATEHLLSTEANRQRLFEALAQASRSPTVYRSRTNPVDRKEATAILREVLPLVDGGGESLKPSRKAVTALAQFIAAIRHDERLGMMVRMTSDELEEDLYGELEGSREVDDVAEMGTTNPEDGTVLTDAEARRRGAVDDVSVHMETEHAPVNLAEVLHQTFLWVGRLTVADRQRFVSEVERWRHTAEVWSDAGRAASLAAEVSEFETDAAVRARRVADAVASGRLDGVEPPPEFFRDAEDFVSGACSAEEFIERAWGRWGLPAEPGLVELLAQAPAPAEQGWGEALAETGGPLTPREAAWADGVLGRSPTLEERRESIEVDADVEFDPPRLGLMGRRVPDFSVDDVVADLESVPGINDDLEQRVAARDAMEEAHRARTERLTLARSALAAIDDVDVVRQVDRVRGVLAEGGLDVESQDLWLTTHLSLLDGATPVEAIGEGLLYEVERAARQRRQK